MRRNVGALLGFLVFGTPSLLSAQTSAIRKVDFKNFEYAWDQSWESGPSDEWRWITTLPESTVEILSGIHRFEDEDEEGPGPAPMLSVDNVVYGALISERKEEAIVSLTYHTGGTANWNYVYVFGLERGTPALMALMETGSRGYGGLVGVSIQRKLLVLDFADKDRMIGDCCSAGFVRVRYRWHGGKFVEARSREYGDMDPRTGQRITKSLKSVKPEN
jgi:hypothetical protein